MHRSGGLVKGVILEWDRHTLLTCCPTAFTEIEGTGILGTLGKERERTEHQKYLSHLGSPNPVVVNLILESQILWRKRVSLSLGESV